MRCKFGKVSIVSMKMNFLCQLKREKKRLENVGGVFIYLILRAQGVKLGVSSLRYPNK